MKTTRSSGPRSTEYSYLFSFFPHSPPSSHFFSWFSSQSSGSRSTEFSHLFSFFLTRHSDHDIMLYLLFDWHLRSTGQFLIQSDHDTSILFVPGQLLVQSDHDTHIHVQSDSDMPYRILTYFLGFSWGICSSRDNFSRTSHPIRSRHLHPCPIR